MNPVLIKLLMCGALVSLSMEESSSQGPKREQRVEESSSRISRLFLNTKPVCVGRYVFDVPAHATVVYGPANAPYRIERYPETGEKFSRVVKELAEEALSNKSKFPIGPASSPGSKVGNVTAGFSDHQKIIYGVDEQTGAFYSLKSVQLIENDIYIQEHSYYGDPENLESVVGELKSIAASIVPRRTEHLPNRAGLCIDGAFVFDNGQLHHERATVGVRLPDFHDVHFSVDMTMKDRLYESDALEPRLLTAEEEAKHEGYGDWYSRIKFFRRAERRIASWKGFEALARRPPQKQYPSSHDFSFVSQGEPRNPMLPVIILDLHTGVQENTAGLVIPSLTDTEVIQVWDTLTNSIRPISSAQKSR